MVLSGDLKPELKLIVNDTRASREGAVK